MPRMVPSHSRGDLKRLAKPKWLTCGGMISGSGRCFFLPFIGVAGMFGLRKTPSSGFPPPAPPPLDAPPEDEDPPDEDPDDDVEWPELGGVDAPAPEPPWLSDDVDDDLEEPQFPPPAHCRLAASMRRICLPDRGLCRFVMILVEGRLAPEGCESSVCASVSSSSCSVATSCLSLSELSCVLNTRRLGLL